MVAMNENRNKGGKKPKPGKEPKDCGGDCDHCDCGHEEQHECDCEICGSGLPMEEAIERLRKWEADMLAQHGWYAHMVPNDYDQSPSGFNAHTHGLELVGRLNFQIVCPLPPDVVHSILTSLVKLDREVGLNAGQDVEGVVKGYKVRLALAMECDRQVLRAIMPDRHGRLGVDAESPFNTQADGCLPNAG
jgi:hypothetical protein